MKSNLTPCQLAPSVLFSICALFFATALIAQDAATPSAEDDSSTAATAGEFGEEIMVTARRRQEDPQTVPVALTALSESALEQRSVRDLSDLSEAVPNMDFSFTGGFADQTSEATVFIRGVGQIDTAIFSDPAVGIYVDGVFLARSQGAVLDLVDLERVEVLRGPQGTLFGKNTTGGAISLVTRRPKNEFGGRLSGTIGRFDRLDGQLSLDFPLSDHLHGSLALLSTHRDGFSRSLVTGTDFYDDNRDAARLSLSYDPGTSFSLYATVDFTREQETGGNQIFLGIEETPLLGFYNQALIGAGFTPYTDEFITGDFSQSFALAPAFLEGDYWGTLLSLNWTREDLAVQSITAYRGFDSAFGGDGDGTPVELAERTGLQEHYQFSQELQLSGSSDRVQWILGALFFRERPQEMTNQIIFGELFDALELAPGAIYAPPGVPNFLCNPGPPPPGLPCFGGAGNPLNFAFFTGAQAIATFDLETESTAVFGEGTWSLNDRTSLTLGGRWTQDDKTFVYQNRNGLGIVDSDLVNENDWTDWSGRMSLAFQATADLMVYGSASRGFKSGGFNGRPQQRQVLDPFDPETVLSFETGFKSDWLDRRLRLNGAAFYSDYENLQFAASVDVAGQPVFITQNAGSAEIQGFELELEARPVAGFLIEATVGFLDTRLVELDSRVPAGLTLDNELPKAPDWSWSLALQHAFEVSDHGSMIARVDYNHRGDTFNDLANTPGIAQEAFGLLNARLVYTPPSGTWEVAVFGTNLTDEQYLETGFFTGAFGVDIGIAGRPQEWGASATYRF